MHRDSKAYQSFLDEAYNVLGENKEFRKALLDSGDKCIDA